MLIRKVRFAGIISRAKALTGECLAVKNTTYCEPRLLEAYLNCRKSCVYGGFAKRSPLPKKRLLSPENCDHANTELGMRSDVPSSWLHEINIVINTGCTRGVIVVGQVIVATALQRSVSGSTAVSPVA